MIVLFATSIMYKTTDVTDYGNRIVSSNRCEVMLLLTKVFIYNSTRYHVVFIYLIAYLALKANRTYK